MNTKPNEGATMEEKDQQDWQAFLWFLRALTAAKTVAEVNAAAGALLQDLGEEPS